MMKVFINISIIGILFALKPVKPSLDDNYLINPEPVPSLNSPVITFQNYTLTEAFVNNPGIDHQTIGVTPTRLWAVEDINGVYASMKYRFPDGSRFQTNFFDQTTNTWVGDTWGYDTTTFEKGFAWNMVVNYSIYSYYKYHFFVTYDSYETNKVGVAWPDTSFIPNNPYVNYIIGSHFDFWPSIGITFNANLHLIHSNINYEIHYDRSDLLTWDGDIPVVMTSDAPWYGFYADPFGNTLVLTYCRVSSDYHIIMLVDTMAGEMFYAGMPLRIDIDSFIYAQTGTLYNTGFVGDGLPFVDRDGNIHLITFGVDGFHIVPVEIYHFFWDLTADTMHVTLIQTLTDYYYPVGINTLVAGRSQIGQVRETGTLYAIWEEFIQEPDRFVVSSTGDTFAPTRIILAQSFDNGLTWNLDTLLESDMIRDSNEWLRFPVISPVIPRSGSVDQVWWGVYDDDDPGFTWQGQGDVSRVSMIVGKKEYVDIEEKAKLVISGFDCRLLNEFILLELPFKAEVFINLYDISGKKVRTIFKGIKEKGKHRIQFEILKIPSGIYFIQARAKNRTKVLRWVRIR